MKQLFVLTGLLLAIGYCRAQSLTPTVIASSGGYSGSGNTSLSYTTGEMTMVKTFSAGGTTLTQGFQQADSSIAIGLLDPAVSQGSFALYPVPAHTQLWFAYQFTGQGKVEVKLFDITGAQLPFNYSAVNTGNKEAHTVNCEEMAAGSYLLSATFTGAGSTQPEVITKQFQVIH
ncbi:MAG: hypothetical protein U0V74_09070 [Chitinophagales bacterium]